MSLPYDVARCAGVGEDGDWRDGCSDCQRRTDRPDALVSMMPPPALIVFECALNLPTAEAGGFRELSRNMA